MAYNYKQQVTARELESILKIRLNSALPVYTEVGGEPVVTFGSLSVGAGGGSIRILDQRTAVDEGWDNIVGAPQKVYTTGVAQIVLEATGLGGAVPTPAVAASGSIELLNTASDITITAGGVTFIEGTGVGALANVQIELLNVVALKKITVAGVDFVEGTDWAKGADDNAAATALAAAIDAAFTGVLNVNAVASGNPGVDPATVNITADSVGAWANAIAVSSDDASMVVSSATLVNGIDVDPTGWAKGVDDDAAATNLAAAITAAFPGLITAVAVPSGNPGVDPATVTLTATVAGVWGNSIALASSDASAVVSGANLTGGADSTTGASGLYVPSLTLLTVIAECGLRGLSVELWYTDAGTAPTVANIGAATYKGSFDTQVYWPLSGRV